MHVCFGDYLSKIGREATALQGRLNTKSMLVGEESWGAIVCFGEAVMLQKQTAERDRERADSE